MKFVLSSPAAFCIVCTPQTCELGTRCPYTQGLHTLDVDMNLCQAAFGISPDQVREQVRLTNLYYGGDQPRWVDGFLVVKGKGISRTVPTQRCNRGSGRRFSVAIFASTAQWLILPFPLSTKKVTGHSGRSWSG